MSMEVFWLYMHLVWCSATFDGFMMYLIFCCCFDWQLSFKTAIVSCFYVSIIALVGESLSCCLEVIHVLCMFLPFAGLQCTWSLLCSLVWYTWYVEYFTPANLSMLTAVFTYHSIYIPSAWSLSNFFLLLHFAYNKIVIERCMIMEVIILTVYELHKVN